MNIRPEHDGDAEAIHAVTVEAFRQVEHGSGTEQFIVRELRRAGALTLSLVAVAEGNVVGHVAVSPVTISSGAAHWQGLGPVSVRPRLQRRGIGTQLVTEALRLLRAGDAAGCVVLGEPAYYGRFGFRANAALVLEGVPPEYFQVLPFSPAVPHGKVRYHPAFDARA